MSSPGQDWRAHAEHAHNLRGLLSARVDTLSRQSNAIFHDARDLLSTLEQERTPLGYHKYDLEKLKRTLRRIVKSNGGKA